jgi:hypothetical protein
MRFYLDGLDTGVAEHVASDPVDQTKVHHRLFLRRPTLAF